MTAIQRQINKLEISRLGPHWPRGVEEPVRSRIEHIESRVDQRYRQATWLFQRSWGRLAKMMANLPSYFVSAAG